MPAVVTVLKAGKVDPGENYISPDMILKACDHKADCLSRVRSKQGDYDEAKDALDNRKTEIIVHDLKAKVENPDALIISGSNDMIRKGQMEAATVKESAALSLREKELNAARHDLELATNELLRIDLLLRNVGR